MAEHVLSPTQTRSTRRAAICSGLAALAAAASAVGITAGFAASVADLVPADDARLFHLSRECLAADRLFRRAVQQQEAVPQPMTAAGEVEWNRLDDIACEWSARVAEIEDEIGELSTGTALGSELKRQTLALLLPLSRRPAGLEDAIGLSLARAGAA